MRTSHRTALLVAVVACAALALSGLWVTAAPPVPATYYGSVLINGSVPALPVTVEALIGGTVYATAQGQSSGGNVVYSLDVPGDIPETGPVEGGVAGNTVTFRVTGLTCAQTGTWQTGARTNLNLTATGTLPTATPTATSTQTPAFTPTATQTSTPAITSTPRTVDLKPSNTNIRDTDISSWTPNDPQAAGRRDRIYVRQTAYNGLSWFDIASQIPTNATIQSARLYLYLDWYEHLMAQTPNVAVYKVKVAWDPLQATWNSRLTGTAWGGAGCSSIADRELVAAASAAVSTTNTWYNWDITALVQDWASYPSTNQGMALISDNGRELRFYSADYTDSRYLPYLRITYTVGLAGPTPTSTTGSSPTPTQTSPVSVTPQRFERQGAIEDTFISSWAVDTNYDRDNSKQLAVHGSASMRPLIKFDLTGIEPGSTVVSATLRLTTREYDDGKTNILHVGTYLVNQAWLEKEATWNKRLTGVNWVTAGCSAIPQDRAGVPSDSIAVDEVSGSTGPGISYTWNITSIAQAWVSDLANQRGLLLMSEDANQREIRFVHSEDSRTERWPLLVIYWVPPATPTPTATITPTPTETPTPTPTLAGGTVTGVVYDDNNGGLANSVRDPGETGVAGAVVQLWQGTTYVDEATTPGSGAYSFENVTEGAYTLIMTAPSGYLPSPFSATQRDIAVLSAMTTEVNFGVYDPLLTRPLLPLNLPLIMTAPVL